MPGGYYQNTYSKVALTRNFSAAQALTPILVLLLLSSYTSTVFAGVAVSCLELLSQKTSSSTSPEQDRQTRQGIRSILRDDPLQLWMPTPPSHHLTGSLSYVALDKSTALDRLEQVRQFENSLHDSEDKIDSWALTPFYDERYSNFALWALPNNMGRYMGNHTFIVTPHMVLHHPECPDFLPHKSNVYYFVKDRLSQVRRLEDYLLEQFEMKMSHRIHLFRRMGPEELKLFEEKNSPQLLKTAFERVIQNKANYNSKTPTLHFSSEIPHPDPGYGDHLVRVALPVYTLREWAAKDWVKVDLVESVLEVQVFGDAFYEIVNRSDLLPSI